MNLSEILAGIENIENILENNLVENVSDENFRLNSHHFGDEYLNWKDLYESLNDTLEDVKSSMKQLEHLDLELKIWYKHIYRALSS